MTEQHLAIRQPTALAPRGFDDPTKDLIRKSVGDPRAPLTTDEFELFIAVCQHTGLNPLLKEIYCAKIDGRFTILTGIDGYRRIAQDSKRFRGQAGPLWCGPDGKWTDVWLEASAPAACKVGIYLPGVAEPTWGVAYYKNYRSKNTPTWKTMPEHMLAVRAEAFALRKCFSRELGGVALPQDDEDWGPSDQVDAGPSAPALDDGGRSARMQAVVDEMDAAIAESAATPTVEPDAVGATPQQWKDLGREPAEQPVLLGGEDGVVSALWPDVQRLAAALTTAGVTFTMPPAAQSEDFHRDWIARMTRALRAKQQPAAQRGAAR